MTLSDNDIDLIEKQLTGELSVEEQEQFDARKKDSEVFAEAWQHQRQILSTFKADQQKALKDELKHLFDDVERPGTRHLSRNWLWTAASFLAFVGVWAALNWTSPSSTLLDKYYQPYPAREIVRGHTDPGASAEIMRWYSKGDYARVVEVLEGPPFDAEPIEGQDLYLGNAYLSMGEGEKAIEVLALIAPGDQYYQDALWYMALAYLSLEDKTKALEVLARMNQQHPFYRKSIASLRSELE